MRWVGGGMRSQGSRSGKVGTTRREKRGPGPEDRYRDIGWRLKSSSSSVGPIRDLVPEERVTGGSGGLSLLGRKRSQEAFEFLREESGWGSALGLLPTIEVLEELSNHAALFDHTALLEHRNDFKGVTAWGTFQRVDLLPLAQQPGPAAPPLLGELLGG